MTREEIDSIFAEHARLEAYDFDGAVATMTPDCYQIVPSLGLRCEGPAQVRSFYAELFGAFPKLTGELTTQTAYARNRIVRWGLFGAEMTGPYLGFEPTGRRFEVLRFTAIEFRDGLLVGEVTYFDADTFCTQLGLPLEGVRAAALGRYG
jgi:hypothetical protein